MKNGNEVAGCGYEIDKTNVMKKNGPVTKLKKWVDDHLGKILKKKND